jgi:hypothetical protein
MKRETAQKKVQFQRARLLKAQSELKELELGRLRGELVPLPLVERVLGQAILSFRTRMLALPRRAVPRLKGVTGDAAREKVLKDLIYEALTAISKFDYDPLIDAAAREFGYQGPPIEKKDEAPAPAGGGR